MLKQEAQLKEQLRYLSHQLLSAQEEERKKISRELHDQIGAMLTGINLELNALKSEVAGNNKSLERKIASTQGLIEDSVEVIHRFARELRPTTLDDLGLIPALHSFTKSLSKQSGMRIRLTVFAAVEQMENAKRTVVYRVVQEALTNVSKHAAATEVAVSLSKDESSATLIVSDNGKGFRVASLLNRTANRRLGLLGMRERVEMVGGAFSLESAPGRGTTVRAVIPLRNSKTKRS